MNDTLARRFDRLEPCMEYFGPADTTPRPAVILFHGCGGVRPHIHLYAEAAARTGARVFVVDSLKMRGWGRLEGITLVCTGLALQGHERSGDVLAALWGVSQRADVITDQIMLAGWSHGGWSIMDLMTQALDTPGDAKLADPDPALISRVRGLFLVYPYIGFPARSARRPWLHQPRTLAVLADRDHLTPRAHAVKVFERLRGEGLDAELLHLDASHAFDEDTHGPTGIMRYDATAVEHTVAAMTGAIHNVLAPVQPAAEAVA